MAEQIAQIAQNEMVSDSSQALNSLTWPEQIEYIMELEYDTDDENELRVGNLVYDDENVIMDLKRLYNHINKRTYDYDLNRYNYLYLTHVSVQQALHLYDSLNETAQYNMISAIKLDHPHLGEMIEVHEMLKPSCITSIYTATIQ